jgi:hypothetical protein
VRAGSDRFDEEDSSWLVHVPWCSDGDSTTDSG